MNERLYSTGWNNYELIDAGGGKKLERWGDVITIRPEIQAYFKSEIPFTEWEKRAHWEFIPKGAQRGVWKELKPNSPRTWVIEYNQLKFQLELTKFKHLGLFPEQQLNWNFIESNIKSEDKFLNLFAYTGAASCVARCQQAEVVHVDAVKQLITWAKANMEGSQIEDIKWVLEDALKFAQREERRGNKYKGIIMDPPAYGLGANGEKWILEDKIGDLLATAARILEKDGFLIVNTYSPSLTLPMLKSLATKHFPRRKFEVKELWQNSTTGKGLYYGNLLRVSTVKD
ncbi:MAG: class I SAM-dependent methyltransferase [Bacteroidota bacterium]